MSDNSNPDKQGADENSASETSVEKAGFWAIVQSMLAGFIGVQSSKNRKRDFSQGSPLPYVIGGIVFTLIFIASVLTLVNTIISNQ